MPIFITGDKLIYSNSEKEILGQGNIIIRQDDMSLFSDKVYINIDSGDIKAEGNILMIYKGAKIYTDKIYYNFKKRNAYTKNANLISLPWICKGKELKKIDNKIEIKNPVFTTCNKKKPHYKMEADTIILYINDKIETWNTVLYLGEIPVFYFPYYTQSLKTEKSPFEFKFGHNDSTGWYVYTKYNMFFDYYNYGYLGFDYMEKIGNNFKINFNYKQLEKLTGNFDGFYTLEKISSKHRWSLTSNNTYSINDRTRFTTRVYTISDKDLNKDFLTDSVDVFRQEYSGYFSTSLWNQSFGISVSDYEELNTITAKYETQSRTLPGINYSLMQTRILPFIYYSHNMNFSRVYNTIYDYYSKNMSVYSNLSFSLPQFLNLLTFSSGINLNGTWTHIDNWGTYNTSLENVQQTEGGKWLMSYGANESIQLNLLPSGRLRLNINHTLSKQLNYNEALKYTGITSNIINMYLHGSFGFFIFNSNTSYNLLKDKEDLKDGKEIDRFSPLYISASLHHNEYNFSANSIYSIFSNQIKNLYMNFNMYDKKNNLWSINVGTTFINNLLDSSGYPNTTSQKDTIYFNTGISFSFTKEFSISIARWYDLTEKKLIEHSYKLTWHLHCWEATFSWTKRQDNLEEIFFTIFISALPQYKLTKPTTTTPGYNLNF